MNTFEIDNKCINYIKQNCLEMIDKASSGHPGMALGSAPILHTLFTKVLNISPKNDKWINRDRFVLSSGHASSLLYTLLHLSGFGLTKEDLLNFRQLGSNTPGHPEIGVTKGVDASTGPLGQGIAYGVGFAISESQLNAMHPNLINHYTYVLCGDGDMQEGVAKEAFAIAGVNNLKKLIVIYDSNDVQLDGNVSRNMNEDLSKEMPALKWNYIKVSDGSDTNLILKAIKKAQKSDKPTLIEVKTIIGNGTKEQGTNKCHGAPIPHDETVELRSKLEGEAFYIPTDVYDYYKKTVIKRGNKAYKEWCALDKPEELVDFINGKHVVDFSKVPALADPNVATRKSASNVLKEMARQDKFLIGGAADIASSVMTVIDGGEYNKDNYLGKNIYFGVRENAMGSIVNALTMEGFKSFASTFFAFSDYMKPALRLAAISHIPSMFVFSHDSIAVGEDGPTHQPIEQITMCRCIPNLITIRPCDGNEVKQAYELAYNSKDKPYVLVLTRQVVNEVSKNPDVKKGAYILSKEEKGLDGILIASGSEVSLALDAKEILKSKGYSIRVVSMPSIELFDLQDKEYKESILPHGVKSMAIEMSEAVHYYKYTENVYGIDKFGISGKAKEVQPYFGFEKSKVVDAFLKVLND